MKNKKNCFFEKKKITIINLLKNPSNGGMPAKDKKTKITTKFINWLPLKPLNSFNVLKYFESYRKNTKKIFVKITT